MSEHNLKKQSQFPNTKMSVTSILTKDYGKDHVLRVRENKASQSQRLPDGDSA
jgi:hypothetical protein